MRGLCVALLVGSMSVALASAQGIHGPVHPPAKDPARAREGLKGTYKLVSIERRTADGALLPLMSEHPTGYVIYDQAGYMAVVLQESGRKPYRSGQPTLEEALATFTTYSGFFGTYDVDAGAKVVTHHKQGSFDPNESGAVEKRAFELVGSRLTLKAPATGAVRATLVLEKMRDLDTLTPRHRTFIGFRQLVGNDTKNEKGEVLPGPSGGVAAGGMTANPGQSGVIIYTSTGVMAVHMMHPNRPKTRGPQPTPAEALEAIRGYNTYFGTYRFEPGKDIVVHERAGSFNPSTVEDVPRAYTFEGNRLTLMPPSTTPGRQGYLTWEALPGSVRATR